MQARWAHFYKAVPSNMDQTLSILLVEDDADTRANLCDILEIDGHNVVATTNATEARQLASSRLFEIILLDRKLPDATADELLPELISILPNAHVIVMTGYANLDSTIAAFRAGAADYLIKPVNIDALRNTVGHIQHTRDVEQQLKQKQEFSNLILDTADAIILVLDLSGKIVQVNDYFQRISGWSQDEVVDQDWFTLCIPEYERERVREVFIQTAEDAHSRGIVNPVLTKAGEVRQIRWSNNTLKNELGRMTSVLAVGIDVTDHMAAERQLLQNERLAGIGQTMAAIAHESRNGLQRIHAGVEMLEEITRDTPDVTTDLMVIKRAANDLNSVFEEVRSFAAPINLHLNLCDVIDTVRIAWKKVMEASASQNVSFTEDFSTKEMLIQADSFRIEQVFRNLFENSIEAASDEAEIHVKAFVENGECCLVVSDSGPGLTKEQHDRIFEPFFTTKAKGTGLGMAIVKRIVTAHEGKIAVLPETDEQSGARFEIRLPIKLSRKPQPA